MYIEFDLTEIYFPTLVKELDQWWNKHQIKFHIKVLNRKAKVTFPDLENYTFFCLTWDPNRIDRQKYRLVEPMNIDRLK